MDSLPGAVLTLADPDDAVAYPYFRLCLPYAPPLRWEAINVKGLYVRPQMESACCGAPVVSSRATGRGVMVCSVCSTRTDIKPLYFTIERTKMKLGHWRVETEHLENLERWLGRYTDPLRANMDSLVIADLVLETVTLVESSYSNTINDPRTRLDARREKAIVKSVLEKVEGMF